MVITKGNFAQQTVGVRNLKKKCLLLDETEWEIETIHAVNSNIMYCRKTHLIWAMKNQCADQTVPMTASFCWLDVRLCFGKAQKSLNHQK